jgi:hypothetical protein
MKLNPADWNLSMRISRRARGSEDSPHLRSLLVHRLRPGVKAVLRVPLKKSLNNPGKAGVFCEVCAEWTKVEGDGDEFVCEYCGLTYVLEFAVFSMVEPGR